MKSISEIAKLSGVTVRTLRYYDSIGLLLPTARTEKGYRLYGNEKIAELQNIMLLRELGFSLDNIKRMLGSKNYDIKTALGGQIKLLNLEKERIDRLISLAYSIMNGENKMDFEAFNKDSIEKYKQEAKERWGNTEEYREYTLKNPSEDKISGLNEKFSEFGDIKNLPIGDVRVQEKVAELKDYITENFYTCSNEILRSLGEMYTADERFKKNIDLLGGTGTAEFVSKAIKYFCK